MERSHTLFLLTMVVWARLGRSADFTPASFGNTRWADVSLEAVKEEKIDDEFDTQAESSKEAMNNIDNHEDKQQRTEDAPVPERIVDTNQLLSTPTPDTNDPSEDSQGEDLLEDESGLRMLDTESDFLMDTHEIHEALGLDHNIEATTNTIVDETKVISLGIDLNTDEEQTDQEANSGDLENSGYEEGSSTSTSNSNDDAQIVSTDARDEAGADDLSGDIGFRDYNNYQVNYGDVDNEESGSGPQDLEGHQHSEVDKGSGDTGSGDIESESEETEASVTEDAASVAGGTEELNDHSGDEEDEEDSSGSSADKGESGEPMEEQQEDHSGDDNDNNNNDNDNNNNNDNDNNDNENDNNDNNNNNDDNDSNDSGSGEEVHPSDHLAEDEGGQEKHVLSTRMTDLLIQWMRAMTALVLEFLKAFTGNVDHFSQMLHEEAACISKGLRDEWPDGKCSEKPIEMCNCLTQLRKKARRLGHPLTLLHNLHPSLAATELRAAIEGKKNQSQKGDAIKAENLAKLYFEAKRLCKSVEHCHLESLETPLRDSEELVRSRRIEDELNEIDSISQDDLQHVNFQSLDHAQLQTAISKHLSLEQRLAWRASRLRHSSQLEQERELKEWQLLTTLHHMMQRRLRRRQLNRWKMLQRREEKIRLLILREHQIVTRINHTTTTIHQSTMTKASTHWPSLRQPRVEEQPLNLQLNLTLTPTEGGEGQQQAEQQQAEQQQAGQQQQGQHRISDDNKDLVYGHHVGSALKMPKEPMTDQHYHNREDKGSKASLRWKAKAEMEPVLNEWASPESYDLNWMTEEA